MGVGDASRLPPGWELVEVIPAGNDDPLPIVETPVEPGESAGPGQTRFPSDLPGKWYVAHTRARNEKALAGELTRLGVLNYLPLTRRTSRSRATHRLSHSQVPVFPGYLFFNGNDDDRHQALRTNRIAKVLDVVNQAQLVAELRRVDFLLSQTGAFDVANRLAAGDWGRIVAGPLRGLEGVITWYAGGLRLWMNVTILGQAVNTQIDANMVERIDPPAAR